MSPYCPQTPINGGLKILLNQTIKVFITKNSKLSLQILPGWSPQFFGVGVKTTLNPQHIDLKIILIHLKGRLVFFRLALLYCPQTPINGGLKILLNQTIKVFLFPKKTKLSLQISLGWSAQFFGVGVKTTLNPQHIDLKIILIHLKGRLVFFRLKLLRCPQPPPINGGFKNLLNQTINVFVSKKNKTSIQISPGWSPQFGGGGGKNDNHTKELSSNQITTFIKIFIFSKS